MNNQITKIGPLTARLRPLFARCLLNKTHQPTPRAGQPIPLTFCFNSKCFSTCVVRSLHHCLNDVFIFQRNILSNKCLGTDQRCGLFQFVLPSTFGQKQDFHTTNTRYLDPIVLKLRSDIKDVYEKFKDVKDKQKAAKKASSEIKKLAKSFYNNNATKVPFCDRRQLLFYQYAEVSKLKTESILAYWRSRDGLNCVLARDTSEWRKVETIVERLKEANPEAQNNTFTWHILDYGDIEAECASSFCTGEIFLSKYEVNKLTDDELAHVLGHEMGHIICQHAVEAQSNFQFFHESMVYTSMVIQELVEILEEDRFDEQSPNFYYIDRVSHLIGRLIPNLNEKFTHEYEADYVGLILMCKADYNPDTTIEAYQTGNTIRPGIYDPDPKAVMCAWGFGEFDPDEIETNIVLNENVKTIIKEYIKRFDLWMQHPPDKDRGDRLQKHHEADPKNRCSTM